MNWKPHRYQRHGCNHIIKHEGAGLFLGMGLGKTSTTLLALKKLIYDRGEVSKVLIVAPKKVVDNVWIQERDKWDDFKCLSIARVVGTARQRKQILRGRQDIFVISRDNISWLLSEIEGGFIFKFDMLVVDELSSFKNANSARFKALKVILPKIKRRVGLTGTPMPNGLPDLWSQLFILDMGKRLGRTIGEYRNTYLTPGQRNGHIVYNYKIKKPPRVDAAVLGKDIYSALVYDQIGDICISMDAKDYLDLPGRIDRTVNVELAPKELRMYKQFEEDLVLQLLEDDEEITAMNAAGLSMKLLQFASGAVYNSDKIAREVHRQKIEVLDELLDTATGPMLVGHWYQHSRDRIMKYLKRYKPVVLHSEADVVKWNKGQISFALVNPASWGHGSNLQDGGNLVTWYDFPNWSSELYEQFVGRLDRQGQKKAVVNTHLVAADTIDVDMINALTGKIANQKGLMKAVKAIVNKYK